MKNKTEAYSEIEAGIKTVEVTEFRGGVKSEKHLAIAEEIPLTIYLNEREIVTLLCTNADLKDLVAGFLISEGFVAGFNEIALIEIDSEKGTAYVKIKNTSKIPENMFLKRLIGSGCGRGTTFYNYLDPISIKKISSEKNSMTISGKNIHNMMESFLKLGIRYKKTTATHSAALADKQEIIVFKEDIGRHNALDKLLGWSIQNNLNTKKLFLLTTGRITSEMLIKAAKIGTAVVISRSSPSTLSLKLGNDLGITIIGRVTKDGFIVYSGACRVV